MLPELRCCRFPRVAEVGKPAHLALVGHGYFLGFVNHAKNTQFIMGFTNVQYTLFGLFSSMLFLLLMWPPLFSLLLSVIYLLQINFESKITPNVKLFLTAGCVYLGEMCVTSS